MAEINLGRVKGDKGDTGADGLTTSVKLGDVSYSHVVGTISLPAYPSKTSELVNDAGFLTTYEHNHDDRYYTETETDTKIATAKTEAITETQTWVKDTFSNPPQNINGDFKIQQRGTSFVAPSNIYTADRYKCNGSGTVTLTSDGMVITGTVTVNYIMETADFNKISGKTITLSYSLNGVITTSTYTVSSATVISLIITDKTLNWLKIELGSVATPFVSRNYGEELALCKRYYQSRALSGAGSIFANYAFASGSTTYLTITNGLFDVQMRQTPTITMSNNKLYTYAGEDTGLTANLIGKADVRGVHTAVVTGTLPNTTQAYLMVGILTADAEI